MKILKCSLPLLLVLFLAASFVPPKGFLYKSEEGKMSVVFPGEYSTDRTDSESAVTIKTICSYYDQTFFASYTLHEVEIVEHADMAETSYESFISSVNGELSTKSEWRIKDNIGLKAIMALPNDVRLEYRVILVGNIHYQLVYMAEESIYDNKAAESFFDSFKLKK